MQTNKPLPHLTIRQGPWAGTMVRFATVEQLRAVQRYATHVGKDSTSVVQSALDSFLRRAIEHDLRLNAPQPKES